MSCATTQNIKTRNKDETTRTELINKTDSVFVISRDSVYVFADSSRTIERHFNTQVIREVRTDSLIRRDTIYIESVVEANNIIKKKWGCSPQTWIVPLVVALIIGGILLFLIHRRG